MRVKNKIAVDFDGTCVDYDYPRIGQDAPEVVRVLKALVAGGYTLTLNTMRSAGPLQEAIDWFKSRGIPLDGVQFDRNQSSWSASSKCFADIYIDDAALGCPLVKPEGFNRSCVDWLAVERLLLPMP